MLVIRRLEERPGPFCVQCRQHKWESDFNSAELARHPEEPICKVCQSSSAYLHNDPDAIKRCSGGGEWKTKAEFYIKDRATGLLFTSCSVHHNEKDNARYAAKVSALPRQVKAKPKEKTCRGKCGQVLPMEEFGFRDATHTVRRSLCKKCHNRDTKERKKHDPEGERNRNSVYRQRVGLAEISRRSLVSIAKKPDYYKEKSHSYRHNNKDVVNAGTRKRRDYLRGRGGKVTAAEVRALFARFDWRCLRCGQQKSLAFDHVDPNGPGSVDNGQPLCTSCNSWKLNKYKETGEPFDFRVDSPYDIRPDLPLGAVDLSMAALGVPEWVWHPQRKALAEVTEKLCTGPLHGPDGQVLPIESFPIRSQKSGKLYRKPYCHLCLIEKQRLDRLSKKSIEV